MIEDFTLCPEPIGRFGLILRSMEPGAEVAYLCSLLAFGRDRFLLLQSCRNPVLALGGLSPPPSQAKLIVKTTSVQATLNAWPTLFRTILPKLVQLPIVEYRLISWCAPGVFSRMGAAR